MNRSNHVPEQKSRISYALVAIKATLLTGGLSLPFKSRGALRARVQGRLCSIGEAIITAEKQEQIGSDFIICNFP
jgi:hypothetical protein